MNGWQPISAPWLVRFDPDRVEVRLLVERAEEPDPGPYRLDWHREETCSPSAGMHPEGASAPTAAPTAAARHDETSPPSTGSLTASRLTATGLGPGIACAAYRLPIPDGCRWRYRLAGSVRATPWIRVAASPAPGEPWRALLVSDHQQRPGVRTTCAALTRYARRHPPQAVLCAGDLAHLPDEPVDWAGHPERRGFLDTLAAAPEEIWRLTPAEDETAPPGWPLLSATPILACAGNHEVSTAGAGSPRERFQAVAPGNWNLKTFRALFLPPEQVDETAPAWFRARLGPLDLVALFVARRWLDGDHISRTGPCYEEPGRFPFADIRPSSPQYAWLRERLAADPATAGMAHDATPATGPAAAATPAAAPDRPWRIVLQHHPPFAQGFNTVPPFAAPLAYRENWIQRHLVPLYRGRVQLVLAGHNHALNHHDLDGTHYFEASHLGYGFPPAAELPDGGAAPDPSGVPGRFFLSEPRGNFFAVLEVGTRAPEGGAADPGGPAPATVRAYRVTGSGDWEEVYAFPLHAGA